MKSHHRSHLGGIDDGFRWFYFLNWFFCQEVKIIKSEDGKINLRWWSNFPQDSFSLHSTEESFAYTHASVASVIIRVVLTPFSLRLIRFFCSVLCFFSRKRCSFSNSVVRLSRGMNRRWYFTVESRRPRGSGYAPSYDISFTISAPACFAHSSQWRSWISFLLWSLPVASEWKRSPGVRSYYKYKTKKKNKSKKIISFSTSYAHAHTCARYISETIRES